MTDEGQNADPTRYPWTREEKVEALGPGPWIDEPDRLEFRHAGFACLVRRVPSNGIFCGYVALPPGHPWHELDLEAVEPLVRVHGGATYLAPCSNELGVCHVPQPGESDDVRWLGFDAGHGSMDRIPIFEREISPGYRELRLSPLFANVTYRDLAFMRAEVERLAEQARDALKPPGGAGLSPEADDAYRADFNFAFAHDMRGMKLDHWPKLVEWASFERDPTAIVIDVVREIRAMDALFSWVARQGSLGVSCLRAMNALFSWVARQASVGRAREQ
jgi:hypothetical protein